MNDKELVAHHAAQQVQNGMLVGLGTGSTANCFIAELARRVREEGLAVTVASSSVISALKAQEQGLPIVSIEHLERLDLYVDGADEITPDLVLLKGRGSDLVREKLMARAADRFLVIADQSKLVGRIGEKFPIPIEVPPFAWRLVKRSLEALGGQGDLRPNANKDGFWITAHGSLVLDMTFPESLGSERLNAALNSTPGVVEHGVFYGLASVVYVADNGQVQEKRR